MSLITLTQFAAPGATPIGVGGTSQKTFVNDYFIVAGLPVKQQLAIRINGLIYELNHAGGADYRLNGKGLRQDASVYTHALSNTDFGAAMAVCDWNAGNVADNTLSADVWTLLNNHPHLLEISELELMQIVIFLRAQLRT